MGKGTDSPGIIKVNWGLIGKYLIGFVYFIKWPVIVLLVAFLFRDAFLSGAWRWDNDTALRYITILRWPLLAIITLLLLKPHLPHFMKGFIKLAFGGVSVELRPTQDEELGKEAVKKIEEKLPSEGVKDPKEVEDLLNSPELKMAFMRLYIVAFGTQIEALRKLTGFPGGLSTSDMQSIFQKHKNLAPDSYNTVDEWMSYLVYSNLVTHNNITRLYHILPAGQAFLDFLTREGFERIYKPF